MITTGSNSASVNSLRRGSVGSSWNSLRITAESTGRRTVTCNWALLQIIARSGYTDPIGSLDHRGGLDAYLQVLGVEIEEV